MSNWRFFCWRSLLSIAVTGVSILPGSYAFAEIAPDAFIDNSSNIQRDNDLLFGGAGDNTFVFDTYKGSPANIYDFDSTNETIQISVQTVFEGEVLIDGFGGSLLAGSLEASQFTLGASATTNAQRLIYNSTTGALYFDQDGNLDGFTQVQFAQLSCGLSLTENNFVAV